MKGVAVGGIWGLDSGRPDGVFDRFIEGLRGRFPNTACHNGGPLSHLYSMLSSGLKASPTEASPKFCVWMADTGDDLSTHLEQLLKRELPEMILVGKVSSLKGLHVSKADLCIMADSGFVLDPQGTILSEGRDFEKLGFDTAKHIEQLLKGSTCSNT